MSAPMAFHAACQLTIDGDVLTASCDMLDRQSGRTITFERSVALTPIVAWLRSQLARERKRMHGMRTSGPFDNIVRNPPPVSRDHRAPQPSYHPPVAPQASSSYAQPQAAPPGYDPGQGQGYQGQEYEQGQYQDQDNYDPAQDPYSPQNYVPDDDISGIAHDVAVGKAVNELWSDVNPMVVGWGWWDKAKKWLKSHRKEVTEAASLAAAAAATAAIGPSAAGPAKQLTTVVADVSYGDTNAAKAHLLSQAEASTNPDVQAALALAKQAVDASKAVHQAQAAVQAAAQGDVQAAAAVAQIKTAAQSNDHPVVQAAADAVDKARAKVNGEYGGALGMMAAWG